MVMALEHADSSPQMPQSFSIAALKPLSQSSTASSQLPDTNIAPADPVTALLQAAVAFSTSKQLAMQLLSAGVMQTIAQILHQGSIRNQNTSLAVDLLWNLLESCPQSDPSLATIGTDERMRSLSPRHSQLAKAAQQDAEESSPNNGIGKGLQDDSLAETSVDEGNAADNAEISKFGDNQSGPATDIEHTPEGDSLDRNLGIAGAKAASVSVSDVGMCSNTADHDSAEKLHNDPSSIPRVVSSAVLQNEADSTVAERAPGSDQTGDIDATGTTAAATASGSDQAGSATSNGTTAPASAAAQSQKDQIDTVSTDDSEAATALAGGLVKVLTDCLTSGYSTADKELRNTVLVVVQLLAQNRQYRAALCDEGMLNQLLVMCTEPELGDCSTSYLKVKAQLALPSSLLPTMHLCRPRTCGAACPCLPLLLLCTHTHKSKYFLAYSARCMWHKSCLARQTCLERPCCVMQQTFQHCVSSRLYVIAVLAGVCGKNCLTDMPCVTFHALNCFIHT